jgi:hypothetical protein
MGPCSRELDANAASFSARGCCAKGTAVRRVQDDWGVGQNFIACDREQSFLLPPDVRECLPEDHLAWVRDRRRRMMDLAAFYAGYREDGHGRAACEPAMMVARLL